MEGLIIPAHLPLPRPPSPPPIHPNNTMSEESKSHIYSQDILRAQTSPSVKHQETHTPTTPINSIVPHPNHSFLVDNRSHPLLVPTTVRYMYLPTYLHYSPTSPIAATAFNLARGTTSTSTTGQNHFPRACAIHNLHHLALLHFAAAFELLIRHL